MRLFLVGVTREDLETLRAELVRFDIAGAATLADLQDGVAVPADSMDAVVMTPRAWRRTQRPSRAETTPAPFESLTRRERDVLALAADGLSNRQIAAALAISEHTVKFHLASVFGKLGATSRTEAVRRGLQLGLVEI